VERPQQLEETYRRGVAAMHANQPEVAAECFRLATDIEPNNANILNSLGVAQQASGRYEEAIRSYDRALALQPDHAGRLNNRGNALQLLGRYAEAVASYDAALAAASNYTDAYVNRGNALIALSQHQAAIESFDRALALRADHVQALCGRGTALLALRQFDAALAAYERALLLRPTDADLHYNHGIALLELWRPQAAIASFDRALAHRPIFPNALNNRGNALRAVGQRERALASYEAALRQDPDHTDAQNNRGIVLLATNRLDAALASFDAALAIRPESPETWVNRGVALMRMLQIEAALSSFDRATALAANCVGAHIARASTLLLAGELKRGWEEYEWRYAPAGTGEIALWSPVVRRSFSRPQWRGEQPIAGKTLLLYGEQGFGDTLQFCRYVPLAAEMGATVILEVRRPLVELLATLPGVARVIAAGDRLPPFDYHCSLMSLPFVFGTELGSIPAQRSYLHADPERIARWRARLGPPLKRRVGIAWSGNAKHVDDSRRSIPLPTLLAALPDDMEWVTLQREIRADDRSALAERKNVMDVSAELTDFAESAALSECLDATISVDTSAAHLSAAIGRPTSVLLPYCPDWRWLLMRDDSPWYPTARLYRQTAQGDWTAPLKRLRAELASFAARGSG
jgi:tetratricopeptide (TPR) repeat protein